MTFSLIDSHDSLEAFLNARASIEPEFHQAVSEVINDVKPIIDQQAEFKSANVFERLVEPGQIISFRVAWQNDDKSIVATVSSSMVRLEPARAGCDFIRRSTRRC